MPAGSNPIAPGAKAHQSNIAAGEHQYYFFGASAPLSVDVNDIVYTYVYLDPANPPAGVMLLFIDSAGTWVRAYWGANNLTWGTDGTPTRMYMGALPPAGQWVRLEVPASAMTLQGSITGAGFELYGGRARWDNTGVHRVSQLPAQIPVGALAAASPTPGTVNLSWNCPARTGLVTTSTDANGKVTTYAYDATGLVLSKIDPADNAGDPQAGQFSSLVDTRGQIAQLTGT